MFLGKEWNTMRQCINYLWTSRKTDSVKMEVMCNILFQFGIPVEMVKVIKWSQNKTYNRVRVDKRLSEVFLIKNGSKKEMLLLNFVL